VTQHCWSALRWTLYIECKIFISAYFVSADEQEEYYLLFVAGVFHDTFRSLSHVVPEVLYPVPDCFNTPEQLEQQSLIPTDVRVLFLSINRYERKKNIALAVEALGLSF